jgi:uridylate kinase
MIKVPTVISLGGSLIAPDSGIDLDFLAEFKKLLEGRVKNGERFVVVCGGGSVARNYQQVAAALAPESSADLDWLGIMATRLNASLVRLAFGKLAPLPVVTDPSKPPKRKVPVLVASGWKPGWSTDYCAALLASKLGAKTIINLSNITYVYSADPKKDPQAQALESVSWPDFQKIVGRKWSPGMNLPFDPIASALGAKTGLIVKVVNGRSLKDAAAAIAGKPFRGTTIG